VRERIVAEHHVVRGHMRLNASILKEPGQVTIGLLAVDRRLVRRRSRMVSGRPITRDDRDTTVVDEAARPVGELARIEAPGRRSARVLLRHVRARLR
jgi:hypothetical protein